MHSGCGQMNRTKCGICCANSTFALFPANVGNKQADFLIIEMFLLSIKKGTRSGFVRIRDTCSQSFISWAWNEGRIQKCSFASSIGTSGGIHLTHSGKRFPLRKTGVVVACSLVYGRPVPNDLKPSKKELEGIAGQNHSSVCRL